MKLLEGLKASKDKPNVVCKLNKSLYGLKQAPRCWNNKFHNFLKNFNFQASNADSCIYRGIVNQHKVFLALFVDDGLIASESQESINLVTNKLQKTFEITVGDGSLYVGLEIERNRHKKTMFLHQSSYVQQLLRKFGMSNSNIVRVPADPHTDLKEIQAGDELLNNVPYREVVGSLTFLAMLSRPDISYAVNLVSRYCNKHANSHWQAVKRILRYLVSTVDYGILFERIKKQTDINLVNYSDTDFVGDVDTRKSMTGYVFLINNSLITWSSQRQKLVTLSTTESEYVAASTACREAMWIKQLLTDLKCISNDAIKLFVDNQSAIRLAYNPELHKRTKHIDIKYHFI